MRFFVDIDKANTLHLEGAELLVFSALSALSFRKPWNGTKEQLANLSRCGSRFTAARSLDHLIELGLVIKTEAGYYVQNAHDDVQNAHDDVQNARENEQNAHFSKESNKEKLNNNNINNSKSVSIKNPDENGQTDFGFLGSSLKNALDVEFDSFFKKWMATFLPVKKTVAREKFDALLDHFSSEEIFGLLDFCAAQPKLTGAVGNKKMNIYWFCDHFTELLQRQNNNTQRKVEILTYSQFKDRFHTTDKAGWCYLRERTDRGERLLCRISDQPASGYTLDRECFYY